MSAESLTQWIGNFAAGFIGRVPIFANGVQIGYADSPADLCAGIITRITDTTAAPWEWTTKGDLWQDISVGDYCANHGIRPAWAHVDNAGNVIYTEPSGQSTTTHPDATGNMPTSFLSKYGQYIMIGGVGLGAVALILMLRD